LSTDNEIIVENCTGAGSTLPLGTSGALACLSTTSNYTINIDLSREMFNLGLPVGQVATNLIDIPSSIGRYIFKLTPAKEGYSGSLTSVYFYLDVLPTSPFINYAPEAYEFLNATSTATSSLIFGMTVHDWACSDTEWEDNNWWVSLRCNAKQEIGVFAVNAKIMLGDFLKSLVNTLTSLFPFSVIKDIHQSWVDSESAAVPANLAWLNVVSDTGEVSFDLPAEWTGTGATSTIPVFGQSVLVGTNPRMISVYAGIRVLSTYIFWVCFLYYIFRLAKNIMYTLVPSSKSKEK
jgi:hypothetical protein